VGENCKLIKEHCSRYYQFKKALPDIILHTDGANTEKE